MKDHRSIIKKALLVNPPSGLYIREDRCQVPVGGFAATAVRPPLDLAYMAATLEEIGVECVIRDYPVLHQGWSQLSKDLEEWQPDLLVLSVTTPTLELDMRACRLAKEVDRKVLTVAKGAHFTAFHREVLEDHPGLDVAIRGEYEYAVQEIAKGLPLGEIAGLTWRQNGQVRVNPARPFIEDLDAIPFPARHLLRNQDYIRPDTGEMQTTIQANRGCPSRCIFCLASRVSGHKVRSRSPENIADELEACVARFGVRNFFFRADTFTWEKDWVISLCREVLARDLRVHWVCNSRVNTLDEERLRWMRKAGCWLISLGIESGNQGILDRLRKDATLEQARQAVRLCKRFGIRTYQFFILGSPWETWQTAEDTIDFARELDGDFVEFHLSLPFPGTELYRIAREKGLIEGELTGHDFARPVTRTDHLTAQQLLELRRKAISRFYLRPSYILRTLRKTRSPRILFNYLRYGKGLLWKLTKG